MSMRGPSALTSATVMEPTYPTRAFAAVTPTGQAPTAPWVGHTHTHTIQCTQTLMPVCMCVLLLSPEVCSSDCGAHGMCVDGVCRCEEGWTGTGCDQRVCNPLCVQHGTCRDGKCLCQQGWNGEHCSIGMNTHTHWVNTYTHRVITHTHAPIHIQ